MRCLYCICVDFSKLDFATGCQIPPLILSSRIIHVVSVEFEGFVSVLILLSIYFVLQIKHLHIPKCWVNFTVRTGPFSKTSWSSGARSGSCLLSASSPCVVPKPWVWGQLPFALPWQRGGWQAPLQDSDHAGPGRVVTWQHNPHPCCWPAQGFCQ